MPSYSIGFCVASTRNGSGSRRVVAVHRHLLLRHRLEQRGLRLRHRAVDLVDEDDVRENRARPELEVPLPLVEDGESRDVGRLQVRRALDAGGDGAFDRLGDRAREHRLRRARHVFEQRVTAAEKSRDDERDLLALAVHDRLDVVEQAFTYLVRRRVNLDCQPASSERDPRPFPNLQVVT